MTTKTKTASKEAAAESAIPTDIPTLSRWLGLDPKEHLKRLQSQLVAASDEELGRLEEGARCALGWAWDEQPDEFNALGGAWLKSTNARLRRIAAGALPLSHEDWRETNLRHLKKLVTDKDKSVRLAAADHLLEDPVGGLEHVKRAATSTDPEMRALAARHLAGIDAETLKKSLALLESLALDPAPEVHWAMAASLAELYERDPRAVLELGKKMAASEDEALRTAAAAAFFEVVLADAFDQLLPTLRLWLKAPEPWLRWTLVRSLRFVRVTPRSLTLFKALFEDKEPEIRRRVVGLLVDLFDVRREEARTISELLRRAKTDQAKRVRDLAEEGEARHGVNFDDIPAPGEQVDLPEEPIGEEGAEGPEPAEDDDRDDDDD